jgi:5-methylcytosine-specific restriction endonuclease McrA
MKHTKETKLKISQTLKRKGIKPNTLPSKEQCLNNLGSYLIKKGNIPWNKGMTGITKAWNKGIAYNAVKGENNGNWKGGKPHCIECDKELKNRKARRCLDCYRKFNKGENHYSWKGGFGQPFRRTGKYKQWRISVYKRDFYTCQECGYKGRELEAHHIKPSRTNSKLKYNINNGITLCKKCHLGTRYKEELFEKKYIVTLGFALP